MSSGEWTKSASATTSQHEIFCRVPAFSALLFSFSLLSLQLRLQLDFLQLARATLSNAEPLERWLDMRNRLFDFLLVFKEFSIVAIVPERPQESSGHSTTGASDWPLLSFDSLNR